MAKLWMQGKALNAPNVNLLRASRAKRLSTFMARELVCFRVRMTMVHKLTAVRKLFVANLAHYALVAMRRDVSLQSCFIVERFAALGARMIFLAWMFPWMFDERTLIATLLSAQPTRRLSKLVLMILHQVNLNFVFLEESVAAQLTLEWLEASVNFCVCEKVERFRETLPANIAAKRCSIGCHWSIIVRNDFRFYEMSFDVALQSFCCLEWCLALVARVSSFIVLVVIVCLFVVLVRFILRVAVVVIHRFKHLWTRRCLSRRRFAARSSNTRGEVVAKLQVLFKRWTVEERVATDFAIKRWLLIRVKLRVWLEGLFSCESNSAMLTDERFPRIRDRISLNVFTHLMRFVFRITICAKSDVRHCFVLRKLLEFRSCSFLRCLLLCRSFSGSSWSGWRSRLWVVIVIEVVLFRYVVVRVVWRERNRVYFKVSRKYCASLNSLKKSSSSNFDGFFLPPVLEPAFIDSSSML